MTRSLADFAAMVAWFRSGPNWWKIAEVLMEYAPLGLRLVQQGCDDVLKFKSEPHSCSSNADDCQGRTWLKRMEISVLRFLDGVRCLSICLASCEISIVRMMLKFREAWEFLRVVAPL
nr:hypothetical protein Iba_chr13eCG12060 [Ipomoea batatas]